MKSREPGLGLLMEAALPWRGYQCQKRQRPCEAALGDLGGGSWQQSCFPFKEVTTKCVYISKIHMLKP